MIIKNWSSFLAKLYISDSPYSKHKEEILTNKNIQKFDLIQQLKISNNELKMNGFSRDSGHWMTYEFTHYEYEIIVNPINS